MAVDDERVIKRWLI